MTISLDLHPVNLEDYFETVSGGAVRIKGHRIGIEHVIERYHDGYSPEQIAQEFPGLSLEKIYATITYYLHNKAEVDTYLAELAAWAEQSYQEEQAKEPPPVVQRLRALKAQREQERQGQ
jgi:uncharacterized protein (DUF433 family)